VRRKSIGRRRREGGGPRNSGASGGGAAPLGALAPCLDRCARRAAERGEQLVVRRLDRERRVVDLTGRDEAPAGFEQVCRAMPLPQRSL
jgi:hypothetical protein